MNARDRLDMLAIMGVQVSLAGDKKHLNIDGPSLLVDAARPMLQQHKDALIAELQRRCVESSPPENAA